MFLSLFLVFNVLISITYQIPTAPRPAYKGNNMNKDDAEKVATILQSWLPCDKQSAWELSGLHEGDIALDRGLGRNGLIDERRRWSDAVVPYYVQNSFTDEEKDLIESGMMEIAENSCVIFRPYEISDRHFVYIQNNEPGCWSYVGRLNRGQALNLGPACFKPGTGIVVHEFLHALGFVHEHSTFNRDDYVDIHYENIIPGEESNFDKYSSSIVTNSGVDYDYGSIMHYGRYAFSQNNEPTITPKQEDVKIGQLVKISDKDITKLKLMYNCSCSTSSGDVRNFLFNTTNVKEDKESDNASNVEEDKESDNDDTNLEEDKESNNDTNVEEVEKSDNATNLEDDEVSDNATNLEND